MIRVKIFGPPGTGKTTRCLDILDHEINVNKTPVHRIAYVTFSVAARLEAKHRVRSRLPGLDEGALRYFKTIHGICYSQVGLNRQNIMQVDDFLDFARDCPVPFSDNFSDDPDIDGMPFGWSNSVGNQIMNIRQVAAARMVDAFSEECIHYDWPRNLAAKEVKHVLSKYAAYKSARSKFDFVDMLMMYMETGEPLPIDVMIIDERQDLSKMQWAICQKMCAGAQRLYMAGDDDQSVYGFLGADPYGFYECESDEDLTLDRTYRLPENILVYANKIINRVVRRKMKNVIPNATGGNIARWGIGADSVLDRIPLEDVMVIGATNWQLASLKQKLDDAGIPVNYKGACITQTLEARQFYWYHRARKGANVPLREAAQILRTLDIVEHKRLTQEAREREGLEIPPSDLEKLGVRFIHGRGMCDYLARSKRQVTANQNLYSIASKFGIEATIQSPKVTLSTYHGSKGREAKSVVLITDCSQAAMAYAVRDPDYERRLAYVGVTRAKENLHICMPQTDSYMKTFVH